MADSDGTDDLVRWARRQDQARELIRTIPDALAWSTDDPVPLQSTAVALADLLRRVHGDEALWSQLRDARPVLDLDLDQKARLRAAVQTNWAGFLLHAGHRPPPPASALAEEFKREITAAIDDPSGVDLEAVRRRIADFATRLDNASKDTRSGWKGRLRAIVLRVQPTLPGIIVVHGTAALLGLGATVALDSAAPAVVVTAAAGLVRVAATKLLERFFPPDIEAGTTPDTRGEAAPAAERLRAALDLADLGRVGENLKTLAAVSNDDSARIHQARAALEVQVRHKVDELFAATFLAIESLPLGPTNQPLLEQLTRLADACAPVAAALMREVPDHGEALRRWPACHDAAVAVAQSVWHEKPPRSDTLTW